MARNLINKYIWLLDTIIRHKRITRSEIDELWMRNTDISEGNPMPRRTFHSYCRAIESTFDVTIICDSSTYEYYIDDESEQERNLRNWLLDSVAISGTISDSRELSSRIVLEEVPSARDYLSIIMDGIKRNMRIAFDYKAFDRSQISKIALNPYFVRIFKQRWYVIGLDVSKGQIRTYSLDRFAGIQLLTATFPAPELDAGEYFKYSFGIYRDDSIPQDIKIKATAEQAKYFRALPLHKSQQEEIHDKYSIFYYKMLVTYDLIQEILSHGNKIEVIAPIFLRATIKKELSDALHRYK
ncbi:MAG: WYL domain-containing protein [Muribaculaceae bacterium]|nr:WYL domain-containing protein [Muribaculaceae bacterium]